MRLFTYSFALFLLTFAAGCMYETELPVVEEATGTPGGTAIIITGAAARITQELALLETLDRQNRLNNVRFISGVSSGAINTVMLNAVLDEDNPFSWQDYKDIVLNLEQSDVLTNEDSNLPVDTRPLWTTFDNTFKNTLGYNSMADLPFSSAVTATQLDNEQRLVVASNVPGLGSLNGDISEVIMASSSFPVAFPAIKIDDDIYADGGLQENIPVNVALQFQLLDNVPFDTVYIVSYQKNSTVDWDLELDLLGVENRRKDFLEISLDRAGFDTDELSEASFNGNLKEIMKNYPQFAERTYVYVPQIENLPYYGVFDFRKETANASYTQALNWAQSNEPVKLEDYLQQ